MYNAIAKYYAETYSLSHIDKMSLFLITLNYK